ncbi:hypothetical protein [Clostridium tagluense]|nr:hypothetical protein [Clostridium tagluense]
MRNYINSLKFNRDCCDEVQHIVYLSPTVTIEGRKKCEIAIE